MNRLLRWFAILLVGLVLTCEAPLVYAQEHGGHGAEEHPQDTGVPGMIPKRDLALATLVTFVLMLAILGKFVWPPLQQGLLDREQSIRQNIADAETNRLKSESMLKDYEQQLAKVHEEVRGILTDARRDAEHNKQEIIATAQKEADATKQRAIAEIERSRDQALGELFDFVSNNVVSATEQVIGRSLTGTDQDRLVGDALAQLNIRRN